MTVPLSKAAFKDRAHMAMSQERSLFWKGYLACLTDMYRSQSSDNPRWLIEALSWYNVDKQDM